MSAKFVHEHSRTALTFAGGQQVPSKTWPQYLAAGLATFGAFAIGTSLSWTSPALPLLMNGSSSLQVSPEEGSWIGSLITLGAFIGALPAGLVANKIGRKRTLQLLAIPMLISWLLIAFSQNVWIFYVARTLVGLAAGAFSVACPMYVSEIAESKIKGAVGTFFQLQITVGILFQYLAGLIQDLRLLALISSTFPFIFLITFSFMPESPVYLNGKGELKSGRLSLQWLRGANYDIDDEMTKIIDQIKEDQKNKTSISELYRSKAAFRGLLIALGLVTFQQLSGINAVIFYTSKIFEVPGSQIPADKSTIVVGTVMVIATYISTVLIDRLGRRILLIISSAVMVLCLGSLSLFFNYQNSIDLEKLWWIPLISITVYITVFSLGFGPIPWLMVGEIFSSKLKGMASSISASVNWLLAFTVTKMFQGMLDTMGSAITFGMFAVICVISTIFVYVFVPETKGKDLNDILRELEGSTTEDKTPKSVEAEIMAVIIKK